MTQKMVKRMIIMLLIVGLVFGAIQGYHMFVAQMMKKYLSANSQPAATVSAISAKKTSWQRQIKTVGTLRAVEGVMISSEVSGMVKKIHFKSGDTVKKGQLLIELDNSQERAQLQGLEANMALAKINFERNQEQIQVQSISQAQLDTSIANFKRAEADVMMQKALMDKKQIRAPFDGVLGISKINLGQFINPSEKIVSLQNRAALYVDFTLPQQEISSLAMNQKIMVNITNLDHDKAKNNMVGSIHALDSEVNQTSRNIKVEGLIENTNQQILPGMFVRVLINIGQPKTLFTLPQTALSFNAFGTTAFVLQPKEEKDQEKSGWIAQQVFVETGDRRGDQVSILSGIKDGDMVVTSGQIKLKNGTPVIINNSLEPTNNPMPTPQEK